MPISFGLQATGMAADSTTAATTRTGKPMNIDRAVADKGERRLTTFLTATEYSAQKMTASMMRRSPGLTRKPPDAALPPPAINTTTPVSAAIAPATCRPENGSPMSQAASPAVTRGPIPLMSVPLTAVVNLSPKYRAGAKRTTPVSDIAASILRSVPGLRSASGLVRRISAKTTEATT